MKKHFSQLIILPLVMIIGCGAKSNNAIQEDSVQCKYYASNIELQDPISIFEQNNYIYVSNFRTSDYLVSIIDEQECKLIGGVLIQGRGPLEATPPVSVQSYQNNIIFHSRGARKVFAANDKNPLEVREIHNFKGYIDQFIMISDSTIIASGNFKDSRFQIINTNSDSIINNFGEYPSFWNEEKNIPNSVKGIFHQTQFILNDSLLAAITNHTIELYELRENQTPQLLKQILIDEYSYRYSSDPKFLYADQDENTTRGVSSVTGDGRFIYLLFDTNKGTSNGKIKHIKVFNWNGEIVRNIKPNINLSNICIDSQGMFIYGLTNQEIVSVVRFEV